MFISVIIKALNEESKISKCIESIQREMSSYESEIILVDSCSIDKTVEIAKSYNLTIIQFENIDDVNCGAAVQLGYQVATGEYIFLIDGDMELSEGFISDALLYLYNNENVAGVAGVIEDRLLTSYSDRRRKFIYSSINRVVKCKSLGGGGLYRKCAIDDVDYFGHSGLESCEELELGVRLSAKGWQLVRIPRISVFHTGHGISDFHLAIKYFKSGRYKAIGKAIRSTINKKWFSSFIFEFKYLMLSFMILCGSFISSLVLSFNIGAYCFLCLNFFVFIALCLRKKNFFDSLLSMFTWYLTLHQVIFGLFLKIKDPKSYIRYRFLHK